MKRTKLCACLLFPLAVVACSSETGTVLQIQQAPAFEDDCTLAAAPTRYQVTGVYDPSGGSAYALPVQLFNMSNDQENPASITGDANIKPSANDALIIGFDYCFYSGEPPATAYDPSGKGLIADCDDLPDSQRAFLPASGTVQSGGGSLVGEIFALNVSALQVLFGETFNPFSIPSGDNPVNTQTRAAAWGNFPADFSSSVIVNVRVRAKRQDGGTMRSNWFAFPVLIAPTAIRDACSAAVLPCGDGTSALQGTEFPPDTCSRIFSGANFTCTAVNQCA